MARFQVVAVIVAVLLVVLGVPARAGGAELRAADGPAVRGLPLRGLLSGAEQLRTHVQDERVHLERTRGAVVRARSRPSPPRRVGRTPTPRSSQPGVSNLPTLAFASGGNNNFSYPQQANFFLAGRYYGRLGGFVMGTYGGVDNKWVMDNVDIRLTARPRASATSTPRSTGLTFNNGAERAGRLEHAARVEPADRLRGGAGTGRLSEHQQPDLAGGRRRRLRLLGQLPLRRGHAVPLRPIRRRSASSPRATRRTPSPTACRPTGGSCSTRTRGATRSRWVTSASTTRCTRPAPTARPTTSSISAATSQYQWNASRTS